MLLNRLQGFSELQHRRKLVLTGTAAGTTDEIADSARFIGLFVRDNRYKHIMGHKDVLKDCFSNKSKVPVFKFIHGSKFIFRVGVKILV